MVSMLCSLKNDSILGDCAVRICITRFASTCGWAPPLLRVEPKTSSYSSPWGSFAYTVGNSKNDRTWELLV